MGCPDDVRRTTNVDNVQLSWFDVCRKRTRGETGLVFKKKKDSYFRTISNKESHLKKFIITHYQTHNISPEYIIS